MKRLIEKQEMGIFWVAVRGSDNPERVREFIDPESLGVTELEATQKAQESSYQGEILRIVQVKLVELEASQPDQ